MTPKEAVVAAMTANRDWMSTHVGVVKFILSECELDNEGNDEYDNVILRNPEEARNAAKVLDAGGPQLPGAADSHHSRDGLG